MTTENTTIKVKPTKDNTITINGRVIYLNNRDLLIEIAASKEQGKMNDTLAKMLIKLVSRYASKGNFVGYTYNDDMRSHALSCLCRNWKSFDANKSLNPFAYFTQIIKNAFIQVLNQEKIHRDIRDNLLLDNGLSASLNYCDDSCDHHMVDDEQDFYYLNNQATNLLKIEQAIEAPLVRDEIGLAIDHQNSDVDHSESELDTE